jgi:acetylglutamate kinase
VLDTSKRLMTNLNAAEVRALIASGVAAGGMVPKLEAAVRATGSGCATQIVDGTVAGALASALGGDDIGTTITG